MDNNHGYSTTFLRVVLGLLFLVPGIMKIMAPDGIIGMLGDLGFPAPTLFGWILILSEIIFGLALVIGLKVEYAVWPLIIIMAVAIFTVHIKDTENSMMWIDVLIRVGTIASLNLLRFTGPGKLSVSAE